MIADGLATDRARIDRRHETPPRPRSLGRAASPADHVPPGAAVLWLGPIDPASASDLEARDCRASVLPIRTAERPEPPHPAPEDVAALDLGRNRYDAAVAPDVLGRASHPEELLGSLRIALKAGGCLVVSVPNAAHPRVVTALQGGVSPYQEGGPIDLGQRRLYTRESLVESIEAADFVVARLVGQADADGQVIAWTAVGLALPVPGLERLQEQFRIEAIARDEAERTAESLRALLATTRAAVDGAHARAESCAERERAARAALAEVHEAMRLRDAEYGPTVRKLLDRLEELEPLRHQAEAAHRQALAAEARCRALELRFEHVLMEIPRRIARKVRARLIRRGPGR